jgi:hypothetical protein
MNKYKINYTLDNIWIFNSFFSDEEFNKIINITKKLNLYQDSRSNNRLFSCIDNIKYKELYDLIYKNKKLINIINSIKKSNYIIKDMPSLPIEYRKYFTGSKGLDWHIDTSLFEPDAFEIVLTLNNSSDSHFEWIAHNTVNSISPQVNDLVIVRPSSVLHRVSPINTGERIILKFVVEFLDNNKNMKKKEFFDELNKCKF